MSTAHGFTLDVKTKALIAAVAFGVAAWLFTCALQERPGARVSMTLLRYTNDVAGMPVFGYAGSNVMHSSDFALFSAHNPTRSHFACFVSCILLREAGSGKPEVIPLKRALHSAQANKTPLAGEDFQLPPGATVTFSVPTPDARGTWQCFISLIDVRHYKHQWQSEAVVFAQRLGLHFGEKGQTVSSREVIQ